MKWILLAALLPALAHANEIASDEIAIAHDPPAAPEKPPPPPEKPRDRSIGFRFGMMNTELDEHPRTLIAIAAQWNVRFSQHLLGLAEYDYLIVTGTEADPTMDVRGRGHDVRAGLRLVMLDTTVRDAALLYMDLEATAGVGYLSDNITGPHVVPNALIGTRLGYELWSKEAASHSNMFGANLLFGALVTEHDVGFAFQIGMEWGNRGKR